MGALRETLERDHRLIEALLARMVTASGAEDLEGYDAFRSALLRHIGIEEKILAPAARARGARLEPLWSRLHADHARLALLLTRRPSNALAAEVREVLQPHDDLEEGPDGFYAICEEALGPSLDAVLAAVADHPAVPLRPLPGPGERPVPRRLEGRSPDTHDRRRSL